TGGHAVRSSNRLLTTIAYQIDGVPTYALEGSIFIAGAAVQWLRDGLKVVQSASDTHALADAADPHQSIYLVPAFVGMGAPHWAPHARGAIYGITRATGPAELARAALESVGYQTRDLIEAMQRDWQHGAAGSTILRVDGGMTASNWAMQFLADILRAPVDRPHVLETTAMGAAYLAGLKADVFPGLEAFAKRWSVERRFSPLMEDGHSRAKYEGWVDAVRRTLS
ncbi:MAG TPA: FGGY-family carbohydrate kinase, partial [Magnetovibrio sp.]